MLPPYPCRTRTRPIRVVHFANLVNQHDFMDVVVQYADPVKVQMGVCVRTTESNIAAADIPPRIPRWLVEGLSRTRIPSAAWHLANILDRWRADILHTHHYDEAVIGWLATRLSPRTRLVVGRHYSDAIYRSAHGIKRQVMLRVEAVVNRSASRIVVPATAIADLLTHRQGVPPGKVVTIPYGFVAAKYQGVERTAAARRELAPDGAFVVGNFARLHEEKGQRYLIEAVARLRPQVPRLALAVVGDGPERAALERQVRDAGLGEAVRLLGWRRDAMRLMAAVDAVVQPSLQEAFSQVMIEAMWMGKPLVMSDVSGAADVVTDGDTGLLVPKADPAALAAAVGRLATDPGLGDRLAAAGRAFVARHLTAEQVVPRYVAMYEDLMSESR